MKENLKIAFDLLVAVFVMNMYCLFFVLFVVGVVIAPVALILYIIDFTIGTSLLSLINIIILSIAIYYTYEYIERRGNNEQSC